VFNVAVTIIIAVVATTGAGIAAPKILGRPLAGVEMVAIALAAGVLAWALVTSHRRRLRKRMQGMRDSALW
jgi:hypothetical protein